MTENNIRHLRALANNSLPLEIENASDIPLTLKQEQILLFEMRRAQIKVEAQKAIETEKRETFRQKHWRRTQAEIQHDEPFLKTTCPQGHTPNYCFNHSCDRRGQCFREKIITANSLKGNNRGEPLSLETFDLR